MSRPGASPPPESMHPKPESEHESEPESPGPMTFSPKSLKQKASAQLNRWSMARAIKSGRKLDRPVNLATRTSEPSSAIHQNSVIDSANANTGLGIHGNEEVESAASSGKSIYMVSDGTGWTADHAVHAALGQFEHCLADRCCSVNTHLISGVEDEEQLVEIVMQAAKEGAMLVYTLADPSMAESAKRACNLWGVQSTDILSPITEAIASHLGVSPSGIPRGAAGRTKTLNEEYFKRIEAIEFTIKQDDGTLPENLHKADIVLIGVSRTGKTPLSTYLAHKGYKVANLPVVMGAELPKILFEVDQRKVFGLTIRPVALQAIRKARAKTLGLGAGARSSYSEMDHVREELEFAGKIFAKNPTWPVIDVTNKAIEETAAVVLRMLHDKRQKTSMPRISKRFQN